MVSFPPPSPRTPLDRAADTSELATHECALRSIEWRVPELLLVLFALVAGQSLLFLRVPSLLGQVSPILFYLFLVIPSVLLLTVPTAIGARYGFWKSIFDIPARQIFREVNKSLPIAIAVVIGIALLGFILNSVMGEGTSEPEAFRFLEQYSPSALPRVWVALWIMLLGPVCEEVFFRGFLFNALRSRLGMNGSAMVQAVLFGLVHFSSFGRLASGILIGLLLVWYYERRKSLWGPIGLHIFLNTPFAVFVLIGQWP